MYFSPSSQKSVTTVWSWGRCRRSVFAARPHLVMPRSFVAEIGSLVRQEVARLVDDGAWPARLAFERC